MSFRLRQRGKDVGETTSLHFLVVQSPICKPLFQLALRWEKKIGSDMQNTLRADSDLLVQTGKLCERFSPLKPARYTV